MTIRVEGKNIPASDRIFGIACKTCADDVRVQSFLNLSKFLTLPDAMTIAQQHEWAMRADEIAMEKAQHIDHQILVKIYNKNKPPRLPF